MTSSAAASQDPKVYKVGTPPTTSRWNDDCKPLVSIWHTCHVHHAIEAIRDGELRSRLVYDQSKLKKHRYTVVWLSPNDWTGAGGSRYGNVNFNIDWRNLVEGMHAFWVEVADYSPKAPRILLTNDPEAAPAGLAPYDQTSGDGPWWYDAEGDQHYWNGNYTLEVMVGQSLSLDRVRSIDFSKHHANRCCLDPRSCSGRGATKDIGRDRFFGGLMLTNTRGRHNHLFVTDGTPGDELVSWANSICSRALSIKPSGRIVASDPEAPALAREFLSYFFRFPRRDYATMKKETAAWFTSGEELWAACSAAIEDFFGVNGGTLDDLI